MNQQGRNESGKFLSKSDEVRQIRSMRLTNTTWDELGKLADERGITRADLIEEFTAKKYFNLVDFQQCISNLEAEIVRLNNEIAELKSKETEQSSIFGEQQLEDVRDGVLFGLKLGKQAPQYKAAKKALDRFIAELLRLM